MKHNSFPRKKLSNQLGFTLVELLASIVIFSLVVTTMYGFFVQASSYTKSSQNKTVAVNLARNAIVYLQKREFEYYKDYLEGQSYIDGRYKAGYCVNNDAECAVDISGDDFFEEIIGKNLYPEADSNPDEQSKKDDAKNIWDNVFMSTINGSEYKINVSFMEIDESELGAGRYMQEGTLTENELHEWAEKLNELIIPIKVEVVWQDQGNWIQRTDVEGYLRNGKAYRDEE